MCLILLPQVCEQAEGSCVWVTNEDCMQIVQKDRRAVYIFEDFSGEAFDNIVKTNNRIFGPLVICYCMKNNRVRSLP